MIARKYSRKIEIYKTENVPDGFGGNTVNDVLIGSFWAGVKQNSAFKDNSIGLSDIKGAYSFNIRTNTVLNPDIDNLSIVYNGVKYNVTDIRYNDVLFREVNIVAHA